MRTLKKALCVILSLAMVLGMVATASAASTTFPKETIAYGKAVDVMNFVGIIEGFPEGDFRPTETLTRAQATKIIAKLLGLGDVSVSYTGTFSDIADNWAVSYIGIAGGLDIVQGVGNGKFNPNGTLTGFAWAKILLCGMGYDAVEEGMVGSAWEANVARLISATKLADGITGFNGSRAITREEACQMAFNALEVPFVTSIADRELAAFDVATGKATFTNKLSTAKNYAGVLGLTKEKTTLTDAFGRPVTTYYLNEGKINQTKLEVPGTPAATYTTAVSYKQIYQDLGVVYSTTKKATLSAMEDGVAKTTGYETAFTVESTNPGTDKIGGQGTLTEIYATENAKGQTDYKAVVINTYVGKLTSWTSAEKDANGAVTKKASATIESLTEKLVAKEDGKYSTVAKTYPVADATNFSTADKNAVVIYNVSNGVIKNIKVAESANVAPIAYSVDNSYFKTAAGTTKFAAHAFETDFIKKNASIQVGQGVLPKVEILSELFGKLNLKDDLVKVYYDNYGNAIYVKAFAATEGVENVYVLKNAVAAKAADKNYYVELSLVDTNGTPVVLKATATGDKFATQAAAQAAAVALKATQLNGLTVVNQVKATDEYATYSFTLVGKLARVASLKGNAVNLLKGLVFNDKVAIPSKLRGILGADSLAAIKKGFVDDSADATSGTFAIDTLFANLGIATEKTENGKKDTVEEWVESLYNTKISNPNVKNVLNNVVEGICEYTAVAPHVDSKTIFLIETENGYKSVTGVKNLPALAAKSILGIGGQFVSYGLGKEVVLLQNAVETTAPAKKAVNADDYIYVLNGGANYTEVGYDYLSYPVIKGGVKTEILASNLLPLVGGTMVKAKDYDLRTGKLTAVYPTLDGHAAYVALQPVAADTTKTHDDEGNVAALTPAIVNDVLYCEGMNFVMADSYKIIDTTGAEKTVEALEGLDMVWVILDGNGYVQYVIIPSDTLSLVGVWEIHTENTTAKIPAIPDYTTSYELCTISSAKAVKDVNGVLTLTVEAPKDAVKLYLYNSTNNGTFAEIQDKPKATGDKNDKALMEKLAEFFGNVEQFVRVGEVEPDDSVTIKYYAAKSGLKTAITGAAGEKVATMTVEVTESKSAENVYKIQELVDKIGAITSTTNASAITNNYVTAATNNDKVAAAFAAKFEELFAAEKAVVEANKGAILGVHDWTDATEVANFVAAVKAIEDANCHVLLEKLALADAEKAALKVFEKSYSSILNQASYISGLLGLVS